MSATTRRQYAHIGAERADRDLGLEGFEAVVARTRAR